LKGANEVAVFELTNPGHHDDREREQKSGHE
jgi:hypothetical protein